MPGWVSDDSESRLAEGSKSPDSLPFLIVLGLSDLLQGWSHTHYGAH